MKHILLAVFFIITFQPFCMSMESKALIDGLAKIRSNEQIDHLNSIATIRNDICRKAFEDSEKTISHDTVVKYLLAQKVLEELKNKYYYDLDNTQRYQEYYSRKTNKISKKIIKKYISNHTINLSKIVLKYLLVKEIIQAYIIDRKFERLYAKYPRIDLPTIHRPFKSSLNHVHILAARHPNTEERTAILSQRISHSLEKNAKENRGKNSLFIIDCRKK